MVCKITEIAKDKVRYENGMELKVHNSGILYMLFNTKERWCDKAESSWFNPSTGIHSFGFTFFYDNTDTYEDILLEWPNHLGSKADFRRLSEQNKDQVELFLLPWEMLK